MQVSRSFLLGLSIVGVLTATTLLAGCGSGGTTNPTVFFPIVTPATQFTQVEEFARPGINEGLFITNDFLNAFNSILPSQEAGALASNAALAGEAVNTLTLLATAGNDAERVNDEVAAFIPDVQRIDTTIVSPVGTPAYANGAAVVENGVILNAPSGTIAARTVPVFMPRAGRKLEDDVIDVTLTVLSNGAVTTDNINYNDPDPAAAQHQKLNGQATGAVSEGDTTGLNGNNEGSAATFPYLAPPN